MTDNNGHAVKFNVLNSVIHKVISMLADRAYDSDKIIDYIVSISSIAVIPSRKNRKIVRDYDKEVYENLNQICKNLPKSKNFLRF